MILSFGPSAESTPGTALAMSVPSVVASLAYMAAALPGERFSGGLRAALLVGMAGAGRCHRSSTSPASAPPVAGSALRLRARRSPSRSGWCWRSTGSKAASSHCPARAAGLRCSASSSSLLAWAFPGQLHPQAASPWAPLHWLLGIAPTDSSASRCCMRRCSIAPSGRCGTSRPRPCAVGRGRAAAAPRAHDLSLRRRRLRRPVGGAVARRLVREPLALGPQDRVLGPRLARLRRPARRVAERSAGAARRRRAGSMSVPCCCCWAMSVRASCSRSCFSAVRRPDALDPCA